MKKTILLVLCALFSLTSRAQLKVDSLGRLSQMPDQSASGYAASIQALENGGLLIKRDYENNKCTNYGVNVQIKSEGPFSAGLNSEVLGVNLGNFAFGTRSIAQGGFQSIGVFGGLGGSTYRGVGIYGSTTTDPILPPSVPSGKLAGLFVGNVKVIGTIYGTLATSSSVSSPSADGATTNLSAQATRGGETVTEKLQQVDLLQMERVNQDGSLAANKVVERGTYVNEEGKEVETEEPIQTKLSAISYGLAADQLQEVYPELVYEDADGNYSINYVEMVPLLVQSIRELKAEVTELKQQLGISDPSKLVLKTKGKAEDADDVTLALPDNGQEATLDVFDLSGKLLRTTSLNAASAAGLSSYTRGLPTGTYAYSLTVDGKRQKARKVLVR